MRSTPGMLCYSPVLTCPVFQDCGRGKLFVGGFLGEVVPRGHEGLDGGYGHQGAWGKREAL